MMANKLITLDRARKELDRLTNFINLVESYESNTLEKWIIKQYALTNSIKRVVEIASEEGIVNNGIPLDRQYVISLINGRPMDELHRILRLGYRQKIKPNRR